MAKIDLIDVYKTLWKCRDFEISTLWQRSVMLGTFLVLAYCGYGALLLKVSEGVGCQWNAFNLLAIGVAAFGIVLSALWVMMMKGSKAWYEQYEGTLYYFQEHCKEAVADAAATLIGLKASSHPDVKDETMQKIDNSLLSAKAGGYSVSKLATMIGIVSFVGWILICVAHLVAIWLGHDRVAKLIGMPSFSVALGVVIVSVTLSIVVPLIGQNARSSFFR